MSTKKLYALTDEQAETLKAWAEYGLSISMDHKELDETADAFQALIPLDTDAAVERMARGLSEHWRDMHTNESLGQQRMLARAALGALLGGEQE